MFQISKVGTLFFRMFIMNTSIGVCQHDAGMHMYGPPTIVGLGAYILHENGSIIPCLLNGSNSMITVLDTGFWKYCAPPCFANYEI